MGQEKKVKEKITVKEVDLIEEVEKNMITIEEVEKEDTTTITITIIKEEVEKILEEAREVIKEEVREVTKEEIKVVKDVHHTKKKIIFFKLKPFKKKFKKKKDVIHKKKK